MSADGDNFIMKCCFPTQAVYGHYGTDKMMDLVLAYCLGWIYGLFMMKLEGPKKITEPSLFCKLCCPTYASNAVPGENPAAQPHACSFPHLPQTFYHHHVLCGASSGTLSAPSDRTLLPTLTNNLHAQLATTQFRCSRQE